MKEELGYCSYCKKIVFDTDTYIVKNKILYHLFCFQQNNLYLDDFDEEMNGEYLPESIYE